jgi:hypothetical protein
VLRLCSKHFKTWPFPLELVSLYCIMSFFWCVFLFLWCSALVEVLFGFTASSTNLTLWFSPERSNRVYVRQPVCFLCSEPLSARIWKIGVEFITRFPCKTLERLVHDCSQCTCCSALLVESCHVWDAEIWSAHKWKIQGASTNPIEFSLMFFVAIIVLLCHQRSVGKHLTSKLWVLQWNCDVHSWQHKRIVTV